MCCDVVIVGGGLSGLQTANLLQAQGISCQLLEGRQRLGGRILSHRHSDDNVAVTSSSASVDMGPSWFWPGQTHMANLIRALNLETHVFWQYAEGDAIMEYNETRLERTSGAASMSGAYRLQGGMQHIVDALVELLPADCIQCNTVVQAVTRSSDGVVISAFENGSLRSFACQHVILALPPRVAESSVQFSPALTRQYVNLLRSIPTWMAAEAKFVALYREPFWRENGLSGDGMSQVGPLVEIHDASPREGGPYALFGFVGVPADHRVGEAARLTQLAVNQLVRMFGEKAKSPLHTYLEDWANAKFTCAPLDLERRGGHAKATIDTLWDNDRLIWAGTEAATADSIVGSQANGYLEGAVQAAHQAASRVLSARGRWDKTTDRT